MNVIAFDTCFGACSAAILWRDAASGTGGAEHLAWRYEEMATGQAERLVPMIDEVLLQSGRSLESLDAIAVTTGPGTFTGIRVGVAAARGLALATGLPIRATTSLHVLAHGALAKLGPLAAETTLAVCMDARAGQIFFQTFDGANGDPTSDAAVMTPDVAAGVQPKTPLVCIGSGAAALAEAAARAGRAATVELATLQPDARILAHIAAKLPVSERLAPIYLRQPDAKPQIGKSLPRAR